MRDEWFDFLPIFILFFFVCYPYEFVQISETVLGKLFVLFLILYYSSVDLVYGMLVCAIVVFYYHVEVSTSIWSIERSRQMQESMMNMMREMDEPTRGSKCGGSKCGGSCGCEKCGSSPEFESFCPASPDMYRYDSVDPSRSQNYNETVLRGVSPKKELEQLMQTKDMNMYQSASESVSNYASVSDMNLLTQPSTGPEVQKPGQKNVVDRIFESIRS